MNNNTCIVTGGAGFIGCAISESLTKIYDEVIAVDSMHPQIHKNNARPELLHPKVTLKINDICDPEFWDVLLKDKKPSVIIHLAAETGTGQSLTEATRHAHVNVVGTTQLLDALSRNDAIPSKLLLSSSRAVYGEGRWETEDGVPFYPGQRTQQQLEKSEWDFGNSRYLPLNNQYTFPMPTSIYGATKLAQEHIISSWCKSYDVNHTILRFQNVYGPGQSLINSYTGIVSLFIRMAKEKRSIPLYEDGEMLRDFIYITDIAEAIIATLLQKDADGKIFDIGSGYGATIKEVAEIISARYGSPEPQVCGLFRNGDVRHASCDISYTRDHLEWSPKVSVESGLELLCRWIDQQMA